MAKKRKIKEKAIKKPASKKKTETKSRLTVTERFARVKDRKEKPVVSDINKMGFGYFEKKDK